jgi:hypothetical protein
MTEGSRLEGLWAGLGRHVLRTTRTQFVLPACEAAIRRIPAYEPAASSNLAGIIRVSLGFMGDVFASVGESVFWLYALDDLLSISNGADDGDEAELFRALRFVRHRVIHGGTVAFVAYLQPDDEVDSSTPGVPQLGSIPALLWMMRDVLGPVPKRHDIPRLARAYDAFLGGREVVNSLERALAIAQARAVR